MFDAGTRNLFNSKKFYISYEKFSKKKKKKLFFFLYFIFISLFFVSTIAKMIIEREKTMNIS